MRDFVRHLQLLILAIVESGNGYGGGRYPMADGEITLHRFFLRRANADDGVFFRYLEGQIVKRVLAESVEVGIPRSPSADIVTSLACLLQDIIARIFDVDGLFRARQWRLGRMA